MKRATAVAAAVSLGALLFAVLAWGSAFDRASATSPALAPLVPPALRSAAWRQDSARALARGRSAESARLAAQAVRADPLDADALAALALAKLAANDPRGAEAAFRLSAQLGWRNRATQLYWLEAALGLGDFDLAALRLDALLRQQPQLDARRLLRPFETSAAGRRALAQRLVSRPPWLGSYLQSFSDVDDLQLEGRARLLDAPTLRPVSVSCNEVAGLIAQLYARNRVAQARQTWRRYCARGNRLLADGGFDAARLTGASPFDWQFIAKGGLDVRLEESGTGRSVVVANSLPVRQVFARQMVQLDSGAYRVGWTARSEDMPSPPLVVRLTCQIDSGAFAETEHMGRGRFAALARVPAGCPQQWLELGVLAGSGAARLDEVTIAPVR